jgi:hypothetical protein
MAAASLAVCVKRVATGSGPSATSRPVAGTSADWGEARRSFRDVADGFVIERRYEFGGLAQPARLLIGIGEADVSFPRMVFQRT